MTQLIDKYFVSGDSSPSEIQRFLDGIKLNLVTSKGREKITPLAESLHFSASMEQVEKLRIILCTEQNGKIFSRRDINGFLFVAEEKERFAFVIQSKPTRGVSGQRGSASFPFWFQSRLSIERNDPRFRHIEIAP